jgi:hypothetical protein
LIRPAWLAPGTNHDQEDLAMPCPGIAYLNYLLDLELDRRLRDEARAYRAALAAEEAAALAERDAAAMGAPVSTKAGSDCSDTPFSAA